MDISKLRNFLIQSQQLPELSAIIINPDEFTPLAEQLKQNGYTPAKNLEEVLDHFENGTTGYMYFTAGNAKPIYDVLSQYPTGVIELFNASSGTAYHCTNTNGRVVLVTTDQALQTANQQGFDVLSKLGMILRLN